MGMRAAQTDFLPNTVGGFAQQFDTLDICRDFGRQHRLCVGLGEAVKVEDPWLIPESPPQFPAPAGSGAGP